VPRGLPHNRHAGRTGDAPRPLRVGGQERQTVLELGALARERQKKRAHTDLLPGSFQRFADLEASATEINCNPNLTVRVLRGDTYRNPARGAA
jgi:hypothetical protein